MNRATPQLTCRVATAADCQLLGELNFQLIRDEEHRNPMTAVELAERMRRWLSEGYAALLFEIDGECVAYALSRETADTVYLRQMFVVRPRRRQGLGRRVVEILRDEVWPKSKRHTVDVLVRNEAAIAFWRAVGYQDYALTLEHRPQ